MPDETSRDARAEADREKRRVALISVFAAVLLTGTKFGVGLWTNSLGVLSEAAHSGLDFIAAAVTFWAVRASAKPADREHTYGHGKIENISALFETLLLFLTCAWIINEAVERLFMGKDVHVDANVWAFLVVVLSIAVDVTRSRALGRIAKKHKSQALEADALHFSTDIWSSSVVLLGLCGVLAAHEWDIAWLAEADAVAALGVAAIVVFVCFRMGKKSVDDLLDRVPRDVQDKIRAAARVPGVVDVKQVRVRRSGPEFFADVTLAVVNAAAFEKAHDIADAAEAAIKKMLPGSDVVVHVEPVAADRQDLPTTVRIMAARRGLGAHGLRIYEEGGRQSLELHLEVYQHLGLEDAHRQATEFEADLNAAWPGLARIITHIEPVGADALTLKAAPAADPRIRKLIEEFLDRNACTCEPHELQIKQYAGELAVSFHFAMAPGVSIIHAHALTELLEQHLRSRIPDLGRVVIHVEPMESHEGA
jgi:cation diffusion facilitator family transporter